MAMEPARPAPRTFIPVTNDSDELRGALSQTGLSERALVGRTTRLTHDLRVAGAGALRPERRDELALHLRYWTAVRRILGTERASSPNIEDYDPLIRTLEPTELFDEATNGAGVSQYEIEKFDLTGSTERFIVDGCRLIRGKLKGIDAHELMSFQETGIFHTKILEITAVTFNARFCSISSSIIEIIESEDLDCYEGLMRDTDITLRVSRRASFVNADLGAGAEGSRTLVDNLAGIPAWRDAHAAVRFKKCRFSDASFHRALLKDVEFTECEFDELDISDANVDGTTFTNCKIAGRDLVLDDLEGAHYDLPPCIQVIGSSGDQ